jgi:Ala-tRNA(Pro) deacylase
MPLKKLKAYLDRENIRYVTISHSPAYTAQDIAASAHVPGKELAKTVIIKIEGKLAMLVLPSNRKVVMQDLRDLLGVDQARFASEAEFEDLFPDCELGAMPPFGNLYGMEVYVAPSLAENLEIAFNAGTHTELMKMAYSDFVRLVKPQILPFTT